MGNVVVLPRWAHQSGTFITSFFLKPLHAAPGTVALPEFLRYLIGKSKQD
jgi:hypothetical protein